MKLNKLLQPILLASLSLVTAACSQAPQDSANATSESAAAPQAAKKDFPQIYDDYLNRDVRDDIFYFVMPDRFYNANTKNDNGAEAPSESHGGYVIDDKFGFHGGDMQGIEAKLDYLKNLGISAIWMTPILRNQATQWGGYGHHGYWILDFTQIDPHFGSNADLKQLIDAAHAKGIKVFFDIITNHTADVIRYEECHKADGSFKQKKTCAYKSSEQLAAGDTYTPFVPKGQENVKTPEWLNDPQYYHNQGDSFWQGESAVNGDFVGLDDLNTQHPKVISGMIDIYKDIISEFKPDGFRIDTVKHVHMPFWSQFSPAIMAHAKSQGIPNFHVFGEVYSPDPVELSSYTTQGKMPAVLDFGFQSAASNVFYRQQATSQISQLFDNDDYYNDHDSQADLLLNFLGNHDMGRAGFFIEDANPDDTPQNNLQRSILSHAFMYMARGIPVIYYGDEQGFTGDGGDVDAREDMFASQVPEYMDNDLLGTDASPADDNFDQQHPLYTALRQLAQLRMDHKALRRGVTFNRYFDPARNVFAISRVDPEEQVEYFVAFNPGNQQQVITVDASANGYQALVASQYHVSQGKLEVTVPALGYVLLKANTPLPVTSDLGAEFVGAESQGQRIKFDYRLSAEKQTLPMLKVTTLISDGQGNNQVVATDYTPPYSAVVLKETLEKADNQHISVMVENANGQSQHYQFTLDSQGQTRQAH